MGKGGRNGEGAKAKLLEAVDAGKEALALYERVTSAHPYLAVDFTTQDGEAEIDGVSVPYVDTRNLPRPDVIPMRGWPENRWPVNVIITPDVSPNLKSADLATPFVIGGPVVKSPRRSQ